MGQVRAIITYRLVGDADIAKDVMRRAAAHTREHFGDRVTFDPFIDEASSKVIWVNSFKDEDTLVEWEQDMGDKTGLRVEARRVLEPVSMDVLDPIADPRLEFLRESGTMMESMLA